MSDTLNAALAAFFASRPLSHIGVAVSGGSDSLALLVALSRFAKSRSIQLSVATVDHGLRPAARDEAALVGEIARDLGHRHDVLTWSGWDGQGNLLGAARDARYGLLADWARDRSIDAIAIGHTSDDVAETFLMRLARGAGLSGLAAMSDDWVEHDARFLRPLMSHSRADLRRLLVDAGTTWIDDPTNDDQTYMRVRMRNALPLLGELGLTTDRLADVATQLAEANATLCAVAHQFSTTYCNDIAGAVTIDAVGFATAPDDIKRRILNAALCHVASRKYVPRGGAMSELMGAIGQGRAHTLHGCQVWISNGKITVARELNAMRDVVLVDGVWDNRWRINRPLPPDHFVRCLGEDGLGQIENWRDCDIARRILIVSPSIWSGNRLIAAPTAHFGDDFRLEPVKPDYSVHTAVLTH